MKKQSPKLKTINARLRAYGLYVSADLKVHKRRGPYGYPAAVVRQLSRKRPA